LGVFCVDRGDVVLGAQADIDGDASAAKTLCGGAFSCRTLIHVFRLAIIAETALRSAAMTAASDLLGGLRR
jgi:hypothetical protein